MVRVSDYLGWRKLTNVAEVSMNALLESLIMDFLQLKTTSFNIQVCPVCKCPLEDYKMHHVLMNSLIQLW